MTLDRDRDTLMILRAAREDIPVLAIARILRLHRVDVEAVLKRALADGQLKFVPVLDWPVVRQPRLAPSTDQIARDTRLVQAALHCTSTEATVVAALLDDPSGVASDRLTDLTASRSPGSLKVIMCRVRKLLGEKPRVKVETLWGVGYRMTPAMQARLREWLDGNS